MGHSGKLRSLSPSITEREAGDILSLEEKFQGGTGVNLTPPPPEIVAPDALSRAKERIAIAGKLHAQRRPLGNQELLKENFIGARKVLTSAAFLVFTVHRIPSVFAM